MDITTSPQYMVLQALQLACSQDTVQLKQAESKLAEWEIEPGFYLMLMQVFSDQTVDGNVRWMAAVYFKNGISKYWRKNVAHEINLTEKTQIRSALISSFREPVPQIAVQIAALIAKIARLDCPKDWPELIPTLIEAVQTTNQIEQHRCLLVLQHVVKALSTKRLISDRKIFTQLTATLYSFVLNIWDGFTTLYFQSLREQQPTEITLSYIEKALLSLKILRKLTIYGFYKPHTSEECMLFIKSMFPRLKESLECRLQLKQICGGGGVDGSCGDSTLPILIELTEKFILKQMKILNEFLELHPLSFIEFIPSVLEFSFNYVFDEGTNMIFENQEISFTNFAIHCINLMKGILSSTTYNTYTQDNLPKEVDVPIAIEAKKEFFTSTRLTYICEKVICHYFLMTKSDLDLWDDDPEAFAGDEGGESWKYALKPCTETFFLTLFSQFRQDMTIEMIKYIQKAQEMRLTCESDVKSILTKDAIYNAAGLSAFNLFDEIDFNEWFTNQLLDEIKQKGNNFRIVRRRAIWLIGQWTGVKFERTLRPQVYAACLHLLQSNEDMCVRLAASKTLMTTMDDFEFESQRFLEYLEPSFALLFVLLKEAKECDTKMNVLNIMSFIVDKMSDNIQKQADNLIQYLPMLWDESKDHNMLRCAIISTLVQIVKALSDVPANLAPFLYPVIGMSTNRNEPSHIYLLEEGLELWLMVIENSTQLTPELLDLSTNIFTIIENTSENLRTTLYIVQSYVLLNPTIYLQRHGKEIVKSCTYLLSDMRPEGITTVMKLFESCLRAKPDYGVEILRPALGNVFKKVYENEDYPMVMTMYLAIVARILIIDQATFSEVLQELNMPQLFETILDVWIAKMPLVSQSEKRKLLSLALASLLTVQNDIIHERFSGIILNICETLNDIMVEDECTGQMTDSLILTDDVLETNGMWNLEDFEYKTYHYERYRQLCMTDPVHTIVLKNYVESQIAQLATQLGPERFNQFLLTVDERVLSNLGEHIKIPNL